MLNAIDLPSDCFACYIVDGKCFMILTRGNGGPAGMGRKLIYEVPIDSEELNGNTLASFTNRFASILTW